MQNLKVFTLLLTLEKEELLAFRKYLKRLHGEESIALKVFDYAKKLYPDFKDNKKLDMDYVYSKIFGLALPEKEKERKNALKKLLNTLSDMYLWLRDFLLFEKICSNSLEGQALWLGILQERGLQTEYARQAARFYAETKAVRKKSTDTYLMEMSASYFHYQHLSLVWPMPDIDTLQQCVDTFEKCAEIIRLKMVCRIVNLRKIRP